MSKYFLPLEEVRQLLVDVAAAVEARVHDHGVLPQVAAERFVEHRAHARVVHGPHVHVADLPARKPLHLLAAIVDPALVQQLAFLAARRSASPSPPSACPRRGRTATGGSASRPCGSAAGRNRWTAVIGWPSIRSMICPAAIFDAALSIGPPASTSAIFNPLPVKASIEEQTQCCGLIGVGLRDRVVATGVRGVHLAEHLAQHLGEVVVVVDEREELARTPRSRSPSRRPAGRRRRTSPSAAASCGRRCSSARRPASAASRRSSSAASILPSAVSTFCGFPSARRKMNLPSADSSMLAAFAPSLAKQLRLLRAQLGHPEVVALLEPWSGRRASRRPWTGSSRRPERYGP